MNPTTCDTACFGGIDSIMCTWSGIKCPSSNRHSLCCASFLNTSLPQGMFEQQGLALNATFRSQDTVRLDAFVRAGSGFALLREEVALPGVERRAWEVWGHARVDAQLYLTHAAERSSEPPVVALSSVIRSVWAQP
jgi:hypothetical protein